MNEPHDDGPAPLTRPRPIAPGVLPLPAIHGLIKHIDAVDRLLSARLTRRKPASEISLTEDLGRILDEESQSEFRLDYSLSDLNRDLSGSTGTCSVRVSLDTHLYATGMENKVTQSDLGIVLKYDDQILPQLSFERGALLQAKRLYPKRVTGVPTDPEYTEASTFKAQSKEQDERIEKVRNTFGDFLSRLLYCPRPGTLPIELQKKLAHLRDCATIGNIFDFALGLELRDDLMRGGLTTAAGIWIARETPLNLADVHAGLFSKTTPLAWWLVERLLGRGVFRRHPLSHGPPTEAGLGMTSDPLALKLIRGGQDQRDEIFAMLDVPKNARFELFPAYTMTVEVGIARDLAQQEARLDAALP